MLFQPKPTVHRRMAAMNMMPPMVGVPALELCHWGADLTDGLACVQRAAWG